MFINMNTLIYSMFSIKSLIVILCLFVYLAIMFCCLTLPIYITPSRRLVSIWLYFKRFDIMSRVYCHRLFQGWQLDSCRLWKVEGGKWTAAKECLARGDSFKMLLNYFTAKSRSTGPALNDAWMPVPGFPEWAMQRINRALLQATLKSVPPKWFWNVLLDCFKLPGNLVFSAHKHARNVTLKWLGLQ